MEKNTWKYVIDSLMFATLTSTAAVGLLLEFVIPKSLGRGSNVFLGVDRHAWGDLHFYLALVFLTSLVVHIVMNRAWIVQSTRRYFQERTAKVLWSFAGTWLVVLFLGWLILLIGR